MAIFADTPSPNQATIRGMRAILGIELNRLMKESTASPTGLMPPMTSPKGIPMASEIPNAMKYTVMLCLSANSMVPFPNRVIVAKTTARGWGRKRGPRLTAAICQTTIRAASMTDSRQPRDPPAPDPGGVLGAQLLSAILGVHSSPANGAVTVGETFTPGKVPDFETISLSLVQR